MLWIVNDLQEQGYLVKKSKNVWLLKNREALITEWTENYNKKLQSAYCKSAFRFQKPTGIKNWKTQKLDYTKTHWGGEPATDILTNYLQPVTFSFYTDENRIDLIKNTGLYRIPAEI